MDWNSTKLVYSVPSPTAISDPAGYPLPVFGVVRVVPVGAGWCQGRVGQGGVRVSKGWYGVWVVWGVWSLAG